jgi:hypothetical protein
VKIEACLWAVFFAGSDANLVQVLNGEAYQCFQGGYYFDVGIGPVFGGNLHTASNGMVTGHLSYMCHHNGDGTDRRYGAQPNTSIADLTSTAPPNGPTSNAKWYYIEDGGPTLSSRHGTALSSSAGAATSSRWAR